MGPEGVVRKVSGWDKRKDFTFPVIISGRLLLCPFLNKRLTPQRAFDRYHELFG